MKRKPKTEKRPRLYKTITYEMAQSLRNRTVYCMDLWELMYKNMQCSVICT